MRLAVAVARAEPYALPGEEHTAISKGADPRQTCLGPWPRLPEMCVLLPPLQSRALRSPSHPQEPAMPSPLLVEGSGIPARPILCARGTPNPIPAAWKDQPSPWPMKKISHFFAAL